ncbi:MAG: hypothetical protein AAGF30_10890 [Pseudomonadota bacterium]
MTPSLLLPASDTEVAEAVVLLAIFAGLFVLLEYGAVYPGMVEFRSAPPFNRVRFGILFFTLMLLALACRAQTDPTTLSRLIAAIGLLVGQSVDFPFSPIRLLMWILPDGTTVAEAALIRSVSGLAYLISLVGLTIFAILIRLQSWPSPTGSFNVWVNLPTFDPTAGSDVVQQLRRDGAVNILLGLFLPYFAPLIAYFVAVSYDLSIFDNNLLLVWMMALWAFLPASLFLRGIAMRRLALIISAKRRRFSGPEGPADPAFMPA